MSLRNGVDLLSLVVLMWLCIALRFKIPWQKWTYFYINPINSVAISFLRYFMLVVIDLINVPCKTESI